MSMKSVGRFKLACIFGIPDDNRIWSAAPEFFECHSKSCHRVHPCYVDVTHFSLDVCGGIYVTQPWTMLRVANAATNYLKSWPKR
jgi:hypothetical protein